MHTIMPVCEHINSQDTNVSCRQRIHRVLVVCAIDDGTGTRVKGSARARGVGVVTSTGAIDDAGSRYSLE